MVAALIAALAASPLSLYHYRAAIRWGRPAHVNVIAVGSCSGVPRDFTLAVSGPTDRRRVSGAFERCAHPLVYVSRLDPTWSEVYDCASSTGSYFLHRGKIVRLQIDGPGCTWAPPGIIRSLHGSCLLVP